MKRADKIVRENLPKLHRLANALLEREILDSEEIDKLLRGEELPPVERGTNGQGQSNDGSKVSTEQPEKTKPEPAAAPAPTGKTRKTP